MCGDTLVSGLGSVQMDAAQAHRRQEKPPARGRVAARHVGSLGVHLGEVDLGTRQALLGRGQEPSDHPRLVGFDGIAVIVQPVSVKDTEIVLRASVAPFRGLKQPFLQPIALCPWVSRRHGRS